MFDRAFYNTATTQVIGILSNGGFNAPNPALAPGGVPAGVYTVLPNNNNLNTFGVVGARPIVGLVPICDSLQRARAVTGNANLVVP